MLCKVFYKKDLHEIMLWKIMLGEGLLYLFFHVGLAGIMKKIVSELKFGCKIIFQIYLKFSFF